MPTLCPYCFKILPFENDSGEWLNHLEMEHDLVVRRKGETKEEATERVKKKNLRMGTEDCQCPRCVMKRKLLAVIRS